MQPDLSALSPEESNESGFPKSNATPTQHGPDDSGAPIVHSTADISAGDAGTTSTSEDQLAADAAFAASLQEELGISTPITSRRLNYSRDTPSPPLRDNRITEYERASTSSLKKREGPGFEVIKKNRSPGDKRSPIQELPNGTFHYCRTQVPALTSTCRNSDAYACPTFTCGSDLCITCLQALS